MCVSHQVDLVREANLALKFNRPILCEYSLLDLVAIRSNGIMANDDVQRFLPLLKRGVGWI